MSKQQDVIVIAVHDLCAACAERLATSQHVSDLTPVRRPAKARKPPTPKYLPGQRSFEFLAGVREDGKETV